MKKERYSLTAKERKEIRQKEIDKANKKNNVEVDIALATNEVVGGEQEITTAVAKRKKLNIFLIFALSALGLILILFAILLPLVFFPQYWDAKYPIARMELSNGMVIEFEIYEDSAPIAATNFIFLAKNKYFDNTIIFDNQNNYVRFGNYESADDYTKMRAKNTTFIAKLPGFTDSHQNNKLSYELNADRNMTDFSTVSQEGVLSFIYDRSSMYYAASEFQVSGLSGASLWVNNSEDKQLSVSKFGRCLNQESINNIKKIGEITAHKNNGSTYFRTLDETIVVKKVTIHNLKNKEKWKNLHFETYMNEGIIDENDNVIKGISGWRQN